MGLEPKRKLVIMNLDDEQDSDGVLTMCKVFGNVIHFNRPPLKKNYAFVTYEDISSAQLALTTLQKKNVKVKYARDDSMSHNELSSTLSLDSNSNVDRKAAIARNEFKSYSVSGSDDGNIDTGMEVCSRCNGIAGLQCERCGDYYCSVACQTVDWSRHRLICFPMPRLIRAKSTAAMADRMSRNVSVTNSPQRKRVETQGTPNGVVKLTADETDAEPNELRKPRAPTVMSGENDVKVAQQPLKGLTPPRKLHDSENTEKPTPVATNGTKSVSPVAASASKPIDDIKLKEDATKAVVVACDELKNGTKVKLVYASNHWSAYIRSAASDTEYAELLQRVVESAATAAKLTALPKRNDMVSAPFLGDHYRAIVVKAEAIDQPIRVAFLDFGNIDVVKFDELRELDANLKAKRFTFRIFLDGVDRETPNQDGFALLKQIENEPKTFTVHSSSNESVIVRDSLVKLVDAKTKECLNDKLAPALKPAETPLTTLPEEPAAPAVVAPTPPKKESKFAKLDLNCKRVMILDDGLFVYGKVACTDVKNKKTVLLNEQIIQDCGTAAKDMPKFNPKVGDKCLARILEGEELWWFRGECLRVNDLKAQLLLLDSGKTVTVTLENVRNFDPKCDFEPRTSICKVKNISVQDGKATAEDFHKLCEKMMVFEEFDVEQVELTSEDEYVIKFACI